MSFTPKNENIRVTVSEDHDELDIQLFCPCGEEAAFTFVKIADLCPSEN